MDKLITKVQITVKLQYKILNTHGFRIDLTSIAGTLNLKGSIGRLLFQQFQCQVQSATAGTIVGFQIRVELSYNKEFHFILDEIIKTYFIII